MADSADSSSLSDSDIDALATEFLNSEQAGKAYARAPFDRRLEVYLRRRGLARLADDGDLYRIFADRVLTIRCDHAAGAPTPATSPRSRVKPRHQTGGDPEDPTRQN